MPTQSLVYVFTRGITNACRSATKFASQFCFFKNTCGNSSNHCRRVTKHQIDYWSRCFNFLEIHRHQRQPKISTNSSHSEPPLSGAVYQLLYNSSGMSVSHKFAYVYKAYFSIWTCSQLLLNIISICYLELGGRAVSPRYATTKLIVFL